MRLDSNKKTDIFKSYPGNNFYYPYGKGLGYKVELKDSSLNRDYWLLMLSCNGTEHLYPEIKELSTDYAKRHQHLLNYEYIGIKEYKGDKYHIFRIYQTKNMLVGKGTNRTDTLKIIFVDTYGNKIYDGPAFDFMDNLFFKEEDVYVYYTKVIVDEQGKYERLKTEYNPIVTYSQETRVKLPSGNGSLIRDNVELNRQWIYGDVFIKREFFKHLKNMEVREDGVFVLRNPFRELTECYFKFSEENTMNVEYSNSLIVNSGDFIRDFRCYIKDYRHDGGQPYITPIDECRDIWREGSVRVEVLYLELMRDFNEIIEEFYEEYLDDYAIFTLEYTALENELYRDNEDFFTISREGNMYKTRLDLSKLDMTNRREIVLHVIEAKTQDGKFNFPVEIVLVNEDISQQAFPSERI